MAFQWFVPLVLQLFGTARNTDLNANLAAIQQAFNNQNAWLLASASFAIPATGPRNVLLNIPRFTGSAYMTVTLPVSPSVGDPPVTIAVASNQPPSGPSAAPNTCVIVTSDSTPIMGVNGTTGGPNGVGDALPYLSNPGETITLQYIGGSIGWDIISRNGVAWYVGLLTSNGQPWEPTRTFSLFHTADLIAGTGGFSGNNGNVTISGINTQGLFAYVTMDTTSGGSSLRIGSASEFYNGSVGPFIIAPANIRVRYKITCISVNSFIVTS